MKRNVFLHIGLHKTGTTSIQHFFHRNMAFYRERGLQFYLCELGGSNASGIAPLILRKSVMSASPKQVEIVKEHLTRFLDDTKDVDVLISGEALSYLRTDEECARLKQLFAAEDRNLIILLTLRDKDDFWESYSNQIRKKGGTGTESEDSRYLLDKDGWLTDFDTLTRVLQRNFSDVRIIQYQDSMVRHFCDSFGFGMPNTDEPRLNQSYSPLRTLVSNLFHRALIDFYMRHLMNTWVGKLKRRMFT
jgi:hypothetical protein